mmetsp:Transcript_48396/g.109852  ORF Transcript_48396/g.109852 Transcript_48396/m.109852 type:complete len:216 (-) Transcript_48396:3645-4292(-)
MPNTKDLRRRSQHRHFNLTSFTFRNNISIRPINPIHTQDLVANPYLVPRINNKLVLVPTRSCRLRINFHYCAVRRPKRQSKRCPILTAAQKGRKGLSAHHVKRRFLNVSATKAKRHGQLVMVVQNPALPINRHQLVSMSHFFPETSRNLRLVPRGSWSVGVNLRHATSVTNRDAPRLLHLRTLQNYIKLKIFPIDCLPILASVLQWCPSLQRNRK